MEKIKSIFTIPKNTIIMGLAISIINIILIIISIININIILKIISIRYIVFSIASSAYIIGLIMYLGIVYLRLKGKEINIKKIKKIVLVLFIISTISAIVGVLFNFLSFYQIAYAIYLICFTVYLYRIFNNKLIFNKNLFFIVNALYLLFVIFDYFVLYEYRTFPYLDILQIILVFPYFYNYYDLLKGSKKIDNETLIAMGIEDNKKLEKKCGANQESDKSWLSTLLLCIFTGYLGIHNFYVGKIGKGILYIFTLGIFGIGTLIDLVMIITENFTDTCGNKITREKSNHNDNSSISTAEEIKKYKDLLDNGIITQEEFEMKKKKLLNL